MSLLIIYDILLHSLPNYIYVLLYELCVYYKTYNLLQIILLHISSHVNYYINYSIKQYILVIIISVI